MRFLILIFLILDCSFARAEVKSILINEVSVNPETGELLAPMPPVSVCNVAPKFCGAIPPNCFPKLTAASGKKIVSQFVKWRSDAREIQIENEFTSGHFPPDLEVLRPVVVKNDNLSIQYFVASDYLALGTNTDYVRSPMTNVTAQRLADEFGFILPTNKMVDQIYFAAKFKLPADVFGEDENIEKSMDFRSATRLFLKSDIKIGTRLRAAGGNPSVFGDFVAGHKKDVILNPQVGRVSIYGWGGVPPIQEVNDHTHPSSYVDYSHGIRFINRWVYVTRKIKTKSVCEPQTLAHVLADPETCGLVSDHCPMSAGQARAYIP